MTEYIEVNLGKYSKHERLRDIFTILLFATQPILWLVYGTIWALIFPLITFGGPAGYFMARANNLYIEIWQQFRLGMLKGIVILALIGCSILFTAYWIDRDAWLWISAVGIADVLFVYLVVVIGWFLRDNM